MFIYFSFIEILKGTQSSSARRGYSLIVGGAQVNKKHQIYKYFLSKF